MLVASASQRRGLPTISILLLTLGTFVMPYLFPVTVSFSQSWATGFNNRVSLACFLLGGLLVGFAWRAPAASRKSTNDRLPNWSFWAATLGVLLLCLAWGERGGNEALYFVDRQMHLSHGEKMYRDFEFIYGPLLLYPGLWLQKLLHLQTPHAYVLNWRFQFVLGTALFWYAIARIDLPVRFRWLVFALLFLFQVSAIVNGGVNYTPLRNCLALTLAVATERVWSKHRNAAYTAASMIVSMAIGFAVSAEQGIGLTLGLCAYALLLSWRVRHAFPRWIAGLVVCAGALLLLIVLRLGILNTTRMFAAGGYSFPLLPSPVNLLILGTYVCGLAWFARALRQRSVEGVAVPLALCGIPMLSAAFGRCDPGHLMSATPLFVLGVCGLTARPRLFAVWVIGMASILAGAGVHRLHTRAQLRALQTLPSRAPEPLSISATIPSGPSYYAPLLVPRGPGDSPRWNADSGFYFGMCQLSNVQQFTLKRDEIAHRRSPLLLLPDTPDLLEPAFWDADTKIDSLHGLELSPWVPKRVHNLPSAEVVSDAIRTMYKSTSQHQDGWRVWALR